VILYNLGPRASVWPNIAALLRRICRWCCALHSLHSRVKLSSSEIGNARLKPDHLGLGHHWLGVAVVNDEVVICSTVLERY